MVLFSSILALTSLASSGKLIRPLIAAQAQTPSVSGTPIAGQNRPEEKSVALKRNNPGSAFQYGADLRSEMLQEPSLRLEIRSPNLSQLGAVEAVFYYQTNRRPLQKDEWIYIATARVPSAPAPGTRAWSMKKLIPDPSIPIGASSDAKASENTAKMTIDFSIDELKKEDGLRLARVEVRLKDAGGHLIPAGAPFEISVRPWTDEKQAPSTNPTIELPGDGERGPEAPPQSTGSGDRRSNRERTSA